MPLQSIEPLRLHRKIADQLRTLIRDGEYAVGSRLPAERELVLQLSVSRPSLRKSLIALEVEGLVEVRPGSGVHVVARNTPASARHGGPGIFGLFEEDLTSIAPALAGRVVTTDDTLCGLTLRVGLSGPDRLCCRWRRRRHS